MNELLGMDRRIERKRWTRKRLLWLAGGVVLVVAIIYALLTVGGSSTVRLESARLTISEVRQDVFQEFIPVSASVTPLKTFYLDAAQGGRVSGVYIEEGAMVSVGDSILRLDNTDLRLDIMYREAQLFEQINNLRNTRLAMEQNRLNLRANLLEVDRSIGTAKRNYDQAVALNEKKLISQFEFDRVKEDYDYWTNKRDLTLESSKQDSILRTIQLEQLEGSVDRMEANLEVIRQRLDELLLKAPVAGQLTARNAEVGESKGMGQRLGQIDILEGFKLRADVDEYYIARIAAGQQAEVINVGTQAMLKVSKVYPEVAGGKFKIDLEFVGTTPPDLRRGQTLQVRVMLSDRTQAVLVPRGGFYNSTGGRWVYLLEASGKTAVKRPVQLGRQNSEVYEVLEGLQPGDKVITSSYETFQQYDKIVLK